jgi:iron(III) transport system substrate-binding protein
LILPDATDNSKWRGGFDAGWSDTGKSLVYAFVSAVDWTAYVNRSIVAKAQLNKIDQLWDPKWKGQIAMQDPRR